MTVKTEYYLNIALNVGNFFADKLGSFTMLSLQNVRAVKIKDVFTVFMISDEYTDQFL